MARIYAFYNSCYISTLSKKSLRILPMNFGGLENVEIIDLRNSGNMQLLGNIKEGF